MTLTSSADYQQLYLYARRGRFANEDLLRQAERLGRELSRFEETCPESEFRVDVSGLEAMLRAHAVEQDALDAWVNGVGRGFEAADAIGLGGYGQGLTLEQIAQLAEEDPEQLSLLGRFLSALGMFGEAVEPEDVNPVLDALKAMLTNRTVTHEWFRAFGRLQNAVLGTGHVGKMDDLYQRLISGPIPDDGVVDRFLRGDSADGLLSVIGLGIAIYGDVRSNRYDGNPMKIVGVNVTKTGIDGAISMTVVGAAVLFGNDVYQLGKRADLAGKDAYIELAFADPSMRGLLHTDQDRSRDALERMDLDNVTRAIAEGVYDVAIAPWEDVAATTWEQAQALWRDPSAETLFEVNAALWEAAIDSGAILNMAMLAPGGNALGLLWPEASEDLSRRQSEAGWNVLKSVGNVIDGKMDLTMSEHATRANMRIAKMDRAISRMPLPEPWHAAANEFLENRIAKNQERTQRAIDWWTIH